jgi:DNA-binding IclR family transcriptional regulator
MRMLECFTEQKPEWGVSEIARHLGLPKSTASTILDTLELGMFVEKNVDTGRYRLGLRLFELGYVAQLRLELREAALRYLEDLETKTQQIVYLTVPCQGEVLYLEAVYPSRRLINYSIVGRRGPMHCTGVGKAILAYLPPDEVDLIVQLRGLRRFTPNTITEPEALHRELAAIRKRGYAIDDMEHDPTVKCVAVPIRNQNGEVVGSVSVSGPPMQFTEAAIKEYAELLAVASSEISRRVNRIPFAQCLRVYGSDLRKAREATN